MSGDSQSLSLSLTHSISRLNYEEERTMETPPGLSPGRTALNIGREEEIP